MDRRRRILMDKSEDSAPTKQNSRRRSTNQSASEPAGTRKSAGYSQDVRNACGVRLVQLIPVRRRSFFAAAVVSLGLPALLLTAHYLIYVGGQLQWYGHPLAVALDASHPNSIAAWLSSHLWLLCLGATILTFQLRRHKLDDYDGEYRLWFWLVLTCLIASVDATTRLSELFGLALDPWAQLQLGWSGPAVVKATLAVLIGMLGLRLCTELKAVPLSLVLWLTGLTCWAASAALGQDELRLEISLQFRIWLKATLWLGGLTAVWLSALTYLRTVYIEAQRRFLLRGKLAASHGVPLRQRLSQHLPNLPKWKRQSAESESDATPATERSGWGMSKLWKRKHEEEASSEKPARKMTARERLSHKTQTSASRVQAGDGNETQTQDRAEDRSTQRSAGQNKQRDDKEPNETSKKRGWKSWIRTPKDSDEPDEYRKVTKKPKPESEVSEQRKRKSGDTANSEGEETGKRSLLSRLPRPSMPKIKKPQVGKWFGAIKLPSLRLPRPDEQTTDDPSADQKPNLRAVSPSDDLPNTSAETTDDGQAKRPLSKAERRRMRRQQQKRAA